MQAAKRVSIHVIGNDFGNLFLDFLSSLKEQTLQDFQLAVVDNATLEGAGSLNERPNTVVLRNIKKQSFSRCHNQLMRLALARWQDVDATDRFILITRPDVILSPKTLEHLVSVMEKDPKCGLVVPRLLRAKITFVEEGERHEFDLTREELSRGYALTRGRRIIPAEAKEGEASLQPFAPTPHAFLVRAAALKETGLELDELFSKVPAVLDLAWNLRLAGWSVGEAPEATIWLEPYQESTRVPACMHLASASAVDEYAEWRLVQTKNDTILLRVKHAPWILGACGLFLLRLTLRPWNGFRFLQKLSLYAKIRSKRRKRERSQVPSREIQERWFI